MKAVVIEQIGSGPVVKDVDEPRRQAGQTLIEVAAAPINPIDISTAAGRYPGGSPDTPFVAGREAVGRVLESDSLAPGARVYVSGLGFFAERAVAGDENVVAIDVEEPQRAEGQTLIEVAAAPINPIDISTAAGRYPGGSPDAPYVAGREAVGRVIESDTLADGSRVYVSGLGFLAERAVGKRRGRARKSRLIRAGATNPLQRAPA